MEKQTSNQEIIETQKKTVEVMEMLTTNSMEAIKKNTYLIDETVKTQSHIISLIEGLYKIVTFISIILFWIFFLQKPALNFLPKLLGAWSNLSEAWQIFVVSIPVVIIAGIAANVIGNIISNKIFKY